MILVGKDPKKMEIKVKMDHDCQDLHIDNLSSVFWSFDLNNKGHQAKYGWSINHTSLREFYSN